MVPYHTLCLVLDKMVPYHTLHNHGWHLFVLDQGFSNLVTPTVICNMPHWRNLKLKVKVLALDIPRLDASFACESRFTLYLPSQEPYWELTLPWCEYPPKCAIISWWWGQWSPWCRRSLSILPHRTCTNFTPWWDEAVAYGNTAQHFHSPTFNKIYVCVWV